MNAYYMEIHSRSVGTHSPMVFISEQWVFNVSEFLNHLPLCALVLSEMNIFSLHIIC